MTIVLPGTRALGLFRPQVPPTEIPAKIADFTAETEELFGLDSTTMSQADALLVCSSDKSAGNRTRKSLLLKNMVSPF